MWEVLLEQQQVIGQPEIGSALQERAQFLVRGKEEHPRPAASLLRLEDGRPGPSVEPRPQGIDVVEDDTAASARPGVEQAACALLLSSSKNGTDPFSTRLPAASRQRRYARASGTARVLPRRYALGLAWLK